MPTTTPTHTLFGSPRFLLLQAVAMLFILAAGPIFSGPAHAAQLLAGAAKIDVTNTSGPVNDPLYVKALVLKSDATVAVIVTVDAVALAEIGPIPSDYLSKVRSQLQQELNISPSSVLVNASHCHGSVCADVDQRTVQAVKAAWKNIVPVRVGAGVGQEDRIMENRRFLLKSGKQADVRHAYSLPPDEEVASVGPIDPEIGILRLDREDGRPLALVYNFACHPIIGVPSGGNTADLTGFASRVLEDAFDGAVALFLQGCAGDINPVGYKDVDHPRDAEPLGNMLGLSALRAAQKIKSSETGELQVVHETLALPRADHTQRIASMQAEQTKLLGSLQGTTLNLKTFLPLAVKYGVSGEYPSYYAHAYLHETLIDRDDLTRLDAENRKNMERYRANIYVMEELTRLQANLNLLKMHQAQYEAAGGKPLEVELLGLRIGDFRLITFPGELSVEIGLNVKKRSPHDLTFVAGYSNGYIYYTPTVEQLANPGAAQEDCDCLVAPPWQKLFEDKAAEVLGRL